MRCLALAEVLRARGAEIHFISRELRGNILDTLRNSGHHLHVLPQPSASGLDADNGTTHAHWLEVTETADTEETQAVLQALGGVDLLVVDHYALAMAWEKRMRRHARSVFVLDDLADRPHDCDLLLDQTPNAQPRYAGRVPGRCRLLTGPDYAVLRAEFAQKHRETTPRAGTVRRMLVCFGGVDAANYTGRVIEALRFMNPAGVQADVIAGLANPHADQLRQQCADISQIRFIQAPPNLAALMAQADLAVGAGGVMLWERACLGLPALTVIVADNQRPVMRALTDGGQIVALETAEATPKNFAQALDSLIAQPGKLSEMSRLNHQLVDGRGCERLARILMPPQVRLRAAEESDRDRLFQWRNTEEVRQSSKNQDPIPREVHDRWFSSTLSNPDRVLLVAEHEVGPVGVLRYDLNSSDALVSIYLVPGQAGRGYGPAILLAGKQWLRQHHPKTRQVNAEILPQNSASRRAFEEAGYKLEHSIYRQSLHA